MTVLPDEFRAAMARLATGVTVVTSLGPERHEVMTANAVTSVSLDPTLLLVSAKLTSRWLAAVRRNRRFAVNVLAAHQEPLARWCASSARHDDPAEVTRHPVTTSDDSGLLLFPDALAAFECTLYAEHPAGDHALVLGEVTAVHRSGAGAPLVFFDRRYATVPGSHLYAVTDVYPSEHEVPVAAGAGHCT